MSCCCFLTDIGPLLGGRIHVRLDKEVHPALNQVLNMAGGKSTHLFFLSSSIKYPASICRLYNLIALLGFKHRFSL